MFMFLLREEYIQVHGDVWDHSVCFLFDCVIISVVFVMGADSNIWKYLVIKIKFSIKCVVCNNTTSQNTESVM